MTGKTNDAWFKLFEKYDIINEVNKKGSYIITANQIREFREPRLMTKFDHSEDLPDIFEKNKISIMPISRSEFIISHHQMFAKLENFLPEVERFNLPDYIQSISNDSITSESIALNCSYLTGMLADFVDDEEIYPTVSGRMSSKKFQYNILNKLTHRSDIIEVVNSQIEIDGAYEGINYLTLVEAKKEICDDFLIRQLYYPYRLWESRVTKPIKLVYFIHSNGIFSFFEYRFRNKYDYNSIELVKKKDYTLEDTTISLKNITDILDSVVIINEPKVPFPQANDFRKVINLCEIIENNKISMEDITDEYSFAPRQSGYYSNACIYLGLIKKVKDENNKTRFELTHSGNKMMSLSYVQRQLYLVEQILKHEVFKNTLSLMLKKSCKLTISEIVDQMKRCKLYKIGSEETYFRRSSTISKWISWIINLIQE